MLEQPENLVLPQRENAQVRSISREVDLAWLAGIIDGEGSLNVDLKMAHNNKPYLQVKVRIANTDLRMVQKIARIYLDLNVVFFYNINYKKKATWKNQMNIVVSSQGSCRKILEATLPYLANKQDSGKVMLEIIKFVQGCPKGGNVSHFDYPNDPTFIKLLTGWNTEKAWHIDPSTTTRKAGTVCSW